MVHQAANGRSALALARRETLHAAVLDLKLPDMEGLSVLEGLLEASPGLPVVVVTGFGTIDTAVDAMKRGAAEFLTKPLDVDRLAVLLDRSVARARHEGSVPTPPPEAAAEMLKVGLVGHSRPMRELFDPVKRIAPHYATVLIVGESGTGKELVARALHSLGRRASGPFVAVNCATLADQILESELFGHEKGAFTSADQPKPGRHGDRGPRHALPGRGQRDGPALAGQAPARPRAPRVPAGGGNAEDQGEPQHRGRLQREPRGVGLRGAVPPRPLLPAEGPHPRGPPAARAQGGHPRPRRAVPLRRGQAHRDAGEAPLRRRRWPSSSATTGRATCASCRT